MAFHQRREEGSSTLAILTVGAGILLTVLAQSQGLLNNRFKAANLKTINSEVMESTLYGLSATKQLVSNQPNHLPTLGFKNPVNPQGKADLGLQALESIQNGSTLSVRSDGTLIISAPDIASFSSEDMNKFFKNETSLLPNLLSIEITPFHWTAFPTGYGVSTIYLEAKVARNINNVQSIQLSRAKVSVKAPLGSCDITVSYQGAIVPSGASIAGGSTFKPNMNCKGVVLRAKLYDNGVLISDAGPVTAANTYLSDVHDILPVKPILMAGAHTLTAEAELVDGSIIPISDFILRSDGNADPSVCAGACTCRSWGDPGVPDCNGTTPYVDYLYGNGPLPIKLPTLFADPRLVQTELDKLNTYAHSYGYVDYNVRWQGAAYPNYPNILVCANPLDYFNLYSFDPNNGCAKSFLSARGILGCLRADSLVTVAPSVYKPIEQLRPGDSIWNPLSQSYRKIKKVVVGPEQKPLLIIKTVSRSLAVTDTHPMKIAAGYVQANQLAPGDRLLVEGKWEAIVRVTAEHRDQGEDVWNLEFEPTGVDDQSAFEAEGIIVGDLYLQQRLSKENADHE